MRKDEFSLLEQQLSSVLNGARAILWRVELPGFRTTFTSKYIENILGYPAEAWITNPDLWKDRIHPKDRDWVLAFTGRATEEGRNHEFEYRMITADGHTIWLRNIVNVIFENGRPRELVGISVDISDRKRADEMASDMTRKLIEAQEQERARIGRELHDDINQRLAMLAVKLQSLRSSSEVQKEVQELARELAGISEDVQSLSHELHSSKLDYLGVIAGMKSWCREFAERHKMEVAFKSQSSNAIPREVGLTLFRILQEALHNAVKHSGVQRVEVEILENAGEIRLVISDSGKGFDVATATQGRGLGLTSMQERVRLLNGRINVNSKPMAGTTIDVRISLSADAGERAS